jgi:hypothetical protein
MKSILHHFAYNITPKNLELVIELFEKLGCALAYREDGARWCMIKQNSIPIDIQVIETNDSEIPIEKRINTHIAFISDTHNEDLEEVRKWAEEKGIEFRQGGWSDKELWFDLPGIFVNFVIEIMHTSVAE